MLSTSSKPKKGKCQKIFDVLCALLSLRLVLVLVYIIMIVLLCVIQGITLFSSPKIDILHIQSNKIVAAQVTFLSKTWYGVDIPIHGANATAQINIKMWITKLKLDIAIPYDFAPQNISQEYRVQDVPCKEFRTVFKNLQIFSLLSIFTGFIVLVLTAANFFTRMFLPLLWFFVWLAVAFTASMTAMMFKLLCDGECYGEPIAIPPFTRLAIPMGGFALSIICFECYLLTSLLTVFL
ncbi:hypothetical protein ABB37_03816 [Leptomonas pyrrhocoris]|uniref:Uncharacterized protein n=1 Tax=Leptomonas pyrrhocoris TaxID=157538 RepID=A0A0N0VFN0_LEPPY|nr:hypothetical protein ABB37_03816 [Leptomonas pyrrhocoris]XP_015659891.1 hypothetical protein ABB37_03816 [Leptomonas pyrrhocoris]KPA81451.1 hypothetical protein ABB37_03816 [Leptomonas pyrrhocoris]KPA81452.1 hypothetical protein ABB37_03816 [Leptomonas pyrrhocoris]|eukprot:XP_015659890.1 hypothetical protein ABB37_03816 [Leptomonas pyrrhocoris]